MEQQFQLSSELQGTCLVLTTSGYINNVGGEMLSKEFGKHLANGIKHVVIDVAQSKVVNSIGVSFLIEMIEQLEECDGKLVFVNPDPAVEKMLNIMGIFQYAGKEPSVEKAVSSFGL